MLSKVFLVFLGGGIGSVFRYLTGLLLYRRFPDTWPLSTWAVNIAGSLLIGLLFGWLGTDQSSGEYHKLLFVTGFCGGFTTFSSFSYENFLMLQEGAIARFIVYVFSSILIGLLMVFIGYRLTA